MEEQMTIANESATACHTVDQAAPLTCEVLTDFAMLEAISDAWRRLRSTNPRAEIFQEFGWIRAFWRAFGAQLSLCTPVVRRAGVVVGILPLVQRGKILEFLGAPDADYNDLLCAEQDAAPVLAAAMSTLLENKFGWRTCELDNLPEHGHIVSYWQTMPPELARHLQLTRRCPCPTILLGAERTATLRDLLQKDSLKRHQKKLEKLGRVSFRHLEDRAEIYTHLDVFFSQHVARHAMNGDRSLFLRSEERAFYRALIEELDPRSGLRFAVLELDGRPIAFHCGFQFNGKFVWYKPTFSVDYWEYAPGEVLLRKLLEYCRDHSEVGEFDFTIGAEQFKTRFANRIRYNFALYADRRPVSVRAQTERVLRRARERLKEHPPALALVRVANAEWTRVRGAIARRGVFAVARELASDALRWCTDIRRLCVFCLPVTSGVDGADLTGNIDGGVALTQLERLPLSELAAWGAIHPDWLRVRELQNARERIKQGQQIFGIRRAGVIGAFAWLDRRGNSNLLQPLDLQGPVTIIHGLVCGPDPSARVGLEELAVTLLRGMIKSPPGATQRNVWFVCADGDKSARAAAATAGFQLRYRLIHVWVFGRVRHTWIHKISKNQLQTCPAASKPQRLRQTR